MSLLVNRNREGFMSPFRSVFSDFFNNDNLFEGNYLSQAIPAVNIKENNDSFEIELAVPGMKKEDFKVDVENGALSISSEKEENKEEEKDNYTRKEFSYSSFKRVFALPDNVDENNIKAKYNEGVLKITLMKKDIEEKKATRVIDIH